jgi:hypothetical protein
MAAFQRFGRVTLLQYIQGNHYFKGAACLQYERSVDADEARHVMHATSLGSVPAGSLIKVEQQLQVRL